MHLDASLLAPLLLLLADLPLTAAKPSNAILLSNVQTLTLRSGKQTTHRRVPAAPQLKCISSPKICALHTVDVMRCTNQGAAYSDEDIQWSCTASLPPELKLGSTDVVCEGYANSNDPYVLKGSCGVEYRLVLTDEGERKFPHLAGGSSWGGNNWNNLHKGEGVGWDSWLFWVIFFAIVAWIVWAAYSGNQEGGAARPQRRPRRDNWGGGGGGGWWPGGGGGGGGGGHDSNDPPPPYPGTSRPKPSSSSSSPQGWQPGFWSGLAGGAAAGYMAGNRNSSSSRRDRNYGGGGWGGGSGSGGWGAGPSNAGPSSYSSSSSGTSSSRHESTGFGSTSRR